MGHAPTENPEAYDLVLRGQDERRRTTREGNAQARRLFVKALDLDPGYAQAYRGRAEVYENLRDYEKALNDYNNALQINPNSIVARNNRGIVLTIIGDYTTAAADFERVLSINANYLAGYNNRSIVYAIVGDYTNALKTIGDGLRIAGAGGEWLIWAALKDLKDAWQKPLRW